MWISHVEVVNVGPFTKFEADLPRGSVGIFGRNGKGKSTLVNLFYSGITNDFGRFATARADCVRNTAGDKEPAYLKLHVEHGGNTLQITRNLKPTKANPGTVVIVNGGEPITHTDKAQEEIEKILGVDRVMLDKYVFKTQDRIFDFISTTPAERAKAYQVLCRTEKCEKLWDVFGEFLNKNVELNQVVTDNSDELVQEIGALKEEMKELTSRATQHAADLLSDKSFATANEIIKKADRHKNASERRKKAREKMKGIDESLEPLREKLQRTKEKYEELQERCEKRAKKADDVRAALRAYDAYREYRRQRKRVTDEAEALNAEAKKKTPPLAPDGYSKTALRDKREELAELRSQLKRAKETREVFDKTGKTECPTCGTSVEHLAEHIENCLKIVASYPDIIAKLTETIDEFDGYETAAQAYGKWKAGFDARRNANNAARESLGKVEAPDGDEDVLKEWLSEHKELLEQEATAKRRYENARAELRDAEASLKAVKEQIAEIDQELTDNDQPEDKIEKAIRRLEEHSIASREIDKLHGELKGTEKLIKDKEDALKKLKVKLRRSRRLRDAAEVVKRAREVVHRDRLPRRVAQTNLARMEGDVNNALGHFGDPFWVEAGEDLSFVVHKPGEPTQPAAALSTGQRVMLAVSFWPAVASLWGQDLGMLAMDEPTANLDEDNRKSLADAFDDMTKKLRGQRQLIVVTHDQALRNRFDKVIDLGS